MKSVRERKTAVVDPHISKTGWRYLTDEKSGVDGESRVDVDYRGIFEKELEDSPAL